MSRRLRHLKGDFSKAIEEYDNEKYLDTLKASNVVIGLNSRESIVRERIESLGDLDALFGGVPTKKIGNEEMDDVIVERISITSYFIKTAEEQQLISKPVRLELEGLLYDAGYALRRGNLALFNEPEM